MATKTGNKGRYICKVGYLDIYAKDTLKSKKDTTRNCAKGEVKSTVYNILHGKKVSLANLNSKESAVAKAIELMGNKVELYGLI
jgi:hypothetical protein